jgi:hypothetical protein
VHGIRVALTRVNVIVKMGRVSHRV